MNSKKARALRKQVNYHPSDERKMLIVKRLVSKTESKIHRVENDPSSTRAQYRALKKASQQS